jgi:hypothetical protein
MTTTTTTVQHQTAPGPDRSHLRTRRPTRRAAWLATAAAALSIGVGAVHVTRDATADGPRSEWTSDDGLRWEHPDGRSYVVASPQPVDGG